MKTQAPYDPEQTHVTLPTYRKESNKKFGWAIALLLAILLTVVAILTMMISYRVSASHTPAPRPDTTVAIPAGTTAFDQGTYVVGRDIEPGSYRTAGPRPGDSIQFCYWKRLKNASGDASSLIAFDVAKGPSTVTISKTDGAFKTSGCQAWVKVG